MRWRALLHPALAAAALVALAGGAATAPPARADLKGDAARAEAAAEQTISLSVGEAADVLKNADPSDDLLAIERARLALYTGDCELSAGILSRPSLAESKSGRELAAVARGCVRSTAGAVTYEDKEKGVVIRFQDDEDLVLGPFMADVAAKARELYVTDLGTELPRPIRVEVVRDQFALSAMTGLPLEAAKTTGTVAIAKWGRVVMVSPRAAAKGYAFLDTLAHELSHLAQTRASRDAAPLWLQEGVARIEESRWRPAHPFDDYPSADDLSAFGFSKHLGPDIDKIGPSIAMLSSATEAQVTYAKVMSFMRFYGRVEGPNAVPKLLHAMADASGGDDLDKSIERASGLSFADWEGRWHKDVVARAKDLPDDVRPDGPPDKNLPATRKRVRLGELFEARLHGDAAKKELTQALDLAPREAVVRGRLAEVLADLGETDKARPLVDKTSDIYANDARWWAMRALLVPGEAELAFDVALGLDPLDPLVACRSLHGKETPTEADRQKLCEAAKSKPRE